MLKLLPPSPRLRRAGRNLLDILAPARCVSCLTEGSWLCQRCYHILPTFSQRCLTCDQVRPRGTTCRHHAEANLLAGTVSAGSYGSAYIRRGVHWLKFKGVIDLAPLLATWLGPPLALIAPLPVLREQAAILPIPLHTRRRRERGFNQSWEIAQAVSRQTGISVYDVWQRQRATASQAELPHGLREENVAEAFKLKPHFAKATRGKKYFLILDDVITTGATLLAAAQVLKIAGAPQVWGVSVARG